VTAGLPVPGLGRPVQVAYAVPDAAAYARRFAEQFGAGPFFLRPHIELHDVEHRGAAATFDHTSAYGQWGDVMVELVQDHGTGPSIVRDMFAHAESGLHHLAFFVDDLDESTARLGALGYVTAMRARTASGQRFHFLDARAPLGHMLELYARNDRLASFYRMVAEAAAGWDGSEPVRAL
jgi:catechol 2,3-dioxygenase-like lactoylglutathione lyase family enzyme